MVQYELLRFWNADSKFVCWKIVSNSVFLKDIIFKEFNLNEIFLKTKSMKILKSLWLISIKRNQKFQNLRRMTNIDLFRQIKFQVSQYAYYNKSLIMCEIPISWKDSKIKNLYSERIVNINSDRYIRVFDIPSNMSKI